MTGMEPDFGAIIQDCFREPQDLETLTRFDAVFRPHLLAVLVAMCHDPSLTEDAYHSALIKFIEIFRAGQRPGIDYAAYFVAIAKNCLIDELRSRQRHLPIDELFEVGIVPPQPDEAAIVILQAMMRLDRRCQFILESYYITQMSAVELAQHLGVRPNSVHMAIKRCRDKLRNILEEC